MKGKVDDFLLLKVCAIVTLASPFFSRQKWWIITECTKVRRTWQNSSTGQESTLGFVCINLLGWTAEVLSSADAEYCSESTNEGFLLAFRNFPSWGPLLCGVSCTVRKNPFLIAPKVFVSANPFLIDMQRALGLARPPWAQGGNQGKTYVFLTSPLGCSHTGCCTPMCLGLLSFPIRQQIWTPSVLSRSAGSSCKRESWAILSALIVEDNELDNWALPHSPNYVVKQVKDSLICKEDFLFHFVRLSDSPKCRLTKCKWKWEVRSYLLSEKAKIAKIVFQPSRLMKSWKKGFLTVHKLIFIFSRVGAH